MISFLLTSTRAVPEHQPDNLQVGFNYGPLHNLDEIVRFGKAVSTASAINFRPDVWLLPFLNVYGIFAYPKKGF